MIGLRGGSGTRADVRRRPAHPRGRDARLAGDVAGALLALAGYKQPRDDRSGASALGAVVMGPLGRSGSWPPTAARLGDAAAWGSDPLPRARDVDRRLRRLVLGARRRRHPRIATVQFIQPVSGLALRRRSCLDERLTTPRLALPGRRACSPASEIEQKREPQQVARVAPDALLHRAAARFFAATILGRVGEQPQAALGDELLVDGAERPSNIDQTGVPSTAASRFIVPPAETSRSASATRLRPSTGALAARSRARGRARDASRCSGVRASTTVCARSSARGARAAAAAARSPSRRGRARRTGAVRTTRERARRVDAELGEHGRVGLEVREVVLLLRPG